MDSLRNIISAGNMIPAKARFQVVRNEDKGELYKEMPKQQEQVCPKCLGAGYLSQSGKVVPCACKIAEQKKRLQQHLIDVSGISSMTLFEQAAFANFDYSLPGVTMAYQEAAKYAEYPDGWLVMIGPYGCGKTHLAISIAKKRMEAGQMVIILTVPDLLDYLREAFDPQTTESYSERFEQMRNVDLLILDDYGAQQGTPWANEKLFQLLNYRYNKRMATVITSNSLEGTEPRLRSRMHDKKIARLIHLDKAQDYRICGDDDARE